MRVPKPLLATGLVSLLLLAVLVAGDRQAPGAAFPGANGRIAYASSEGGNWDIYTMNGNGDGKTPLTNNPGNDTQPSFSPNGSKIAFASDRSGNWDVYTMNADGSGVARLTTDPGSDTQPSFSPDGGQIAYIGKHGASWYGDVYLMNADGTEQVRLTQQGGAEDGPTFSPDGQLIAFGRVAAGHKHIFRMNPAGEELTALTHGAFDDRQASFSPDGQQIAFSSRREGHAEIFTMRANGNGLTRLTGKLSNAMPAYSPDGQRIAFVRGGAVFTMNAGGGGETQLTKGRGSQAWPNWQPLVGFSPGSSHAHGDFRIGKPILNKRRGIAKLPVTIPAAGTLSLRGRTVRPPARRSVAGAGTVKLLVKPKARTARALARKTRAKVKVTVSYARESGGRETRTKKFSLRKKRR